MLKLHFFSIPERATLPSNQEPDLLAIDTIVKIIQNDKHLSSFVAQKIKEKVNSSNAKVVLQSLDVKLFNFLSKQNLRVSITLC